MKKSFYLPLIILAAGLMSCNKDIPVAENPEIGEEIILNVQDETTFDAELDTKTTAISAVPSSLYWGASTGSAGSETSKYAATSSSVSSSKIATGKYQTATATAYNYYVANQTFTIGTSTTMTVANNNTDVIAGRSASATTSTTPSVTLGHIFARTGSFSISSNQGYTVSNAAWKIVGKSDINGTAGTYNLTTAAWTAASTKLTTETTVTSSSDLYLIPGTYTIKCTYTLAKGDYTNSFTSSQDVTLVAGKVNNITATVSKNPASGITISVSLTAWGTNGIAITYE